MTCTSDRSGRRRPASCAGPSSPGRQHPAPGQQHQEAVGHRPADQRGDHRGAPVHRSRQAVGRGRFAVDRGDHVPRRLAGGSEAHAVARVFSRVQVGLRQAGRAWSSGHFQRRDGFVFEGDRRRRLDHPTAGAELARGPCCWPTAVRVDAPLPPARAVSPAGLGVDQELPEVTTAWPAGLQAASRRARPSTSPPRVLHLHGR